MMIQVLGAFIAVLTSSVMFGAPKRFIIYAGITGAVGQFIYMRSIEWKLNEVIAVFVGSMIVALVSHSLARLFRAPVTIFFIPGILPMVPGLAMYRSVYFFISGDRGQASYYLVQSIQIAGMIALAIFIMDSFFRILQKKVQIQTTEDKERI